MQALPLSMIIVGLVVIYTEFYIYYIGKADMAFLTDVLADGEYIVMGLLALVSILV